MCVCTIIEITTVIHTYIYWNITVTLVWLCCVTWDGSVQDTKICVLCWSTINHRTTTCWFTHFKFIWITVHSSLLLSQELWLMRYATVGMPTSQAVTVSAQVNEICYEHCRIYPTYVLTIAVRRFHTYSAVAVSLPRPLFSFIGSPSGLGKIFDSSVTYC